MSTIHPNDMATTLIHAKKRGHLEHTFKVYEKEQDAYMLSIALSLVAASGHMPIVVDCLKMAYDPCPADKSFVNPLMYYTLEDISNASDAESFANLVTSFKPSDTKFLTCIRYKVLHRIDVMDVLKIIMTKSIVSIDDLPSWLTSHDFDRIHYAYNAIALEEAFQYLASFATEDVLERALSFVEKNEHIKIAHGDDVPMVICCWSQAYFPQRLFDKIKALLELVKTKNAHINDF